MSYKVYIYVITLMLSIYATSGINYDGFIKKNKAIEARVLVILMSIALSYLATNFIYDFISLTSIIKKWKTSFFVDNSSVINMKFNTY